MAHKQNLETNPFLKDIQKVWKNSDDYVISYLRASMKVGSSKDITEDLMFLVNLRLTIKSL